MSDADETSDKRVIVEEFDRSILIDIYLDGVCTGIASAAMQLTKDPKFSDDLADDMVRSLKSDPLAMEMIRTEVKERMLGIDTGVKEITTKAVDK